MTPEGLILVGPDFLTKPLNRQHDPLKTVARAAHAVTGSQLSVYQPRLIDPLCQAPCGVDRIAISAAIIAQRVAIG